MDITYNTIVISGGGIQSISYIGALQSLYDKGLITKNMKLYCSKDTMETFENYILDKEFIITLKVMHINGLQTQ